MMKSFTVMSLSGLSILILILDGFVFQAGGWDNFELPYYSLIRVFNNQTQELNDLRKQDIDPAEATRIDLNQLLDGGPPKDGIPSIDNPRFDTAETTPFDADEQIVGVVVNGDARAYPYGIMDWHEIVSDTIGGLNIR